MAWNHELLQRETSIDPAAEEEHIQRCIGIRGLNIGFGPVFFHMESDSEKGRDHRTSLTVTGLAIRSILTKVTQNSVDLRARPLRLYHSDRLQIQLIRGRKRNQRIPVALVFIVTLLPGYLGSWPEKTGMTMKTSATGKVSF